MGLLKSIEEFYEGKVLLVDKPFGWTSFDVVNKIRGTIQHKRNKIKVGHAGTLDPLATGLLIICTGKMTKSIQEFQDLDKCYSGEITLGKTTPSYDAETEVDCILPIEHITKELIVSTARKMEGEQQQFPPIYSAIKIDGKTAYKEARKGRDIELSSRKINIKNFEIKQVIMPFVEFQVTCSKGTYIRSLAHDIGKKLNSGGYLSRLQRESIGNFNLKDAYNLSDLIANIEELKNENTQRSS